VRHQGDAASDYYRLRDGKAYFGDFDPFGDFDLIFGASKLNLKAIDLPIRYARAPTARHRSRGFGTV
jgi:hypothetical protein